LNSVGWQWAQTDPLAAAAYAQTLAPGNTQNALLNNVANQWAQADPQAALVWASNLPAGQGRNNALQGVISSWAQADPQSAAAYALTLPPGQTRNQACPASPVNGRKGTRPRRSSGSTICLRDRPSATRCVK